MSVDQKKIVSALPVSGFFVAPPRYSACKVSAENGLFSGQMAGMPFEWNPLGTIFRDPKISHFLRLRTLLAAASFWLLFLRC